MSGFEMLDLSEILDFCGPPDNRLLHRIRVLREGGMDFATAKRLAKREMCLEELRSAYPDFEYADLLAWVHDEEVDAEERAHLEMLDAQDEDRAERYAA